MDRITFDPDWTDRFFGYGLNFEKAGEKPDEFYRKIGVLKEGVCAECGNVFYYGDVKSHAFKVKRDGKMLVFCRYNCMRAKQRKIEHQSKERYAARTKRRAEIAATKKAQRAKQGG